MHSTFRVLLIDDHPIIIDAYKNSLDQVRLSYNTLKLEVDSATCCDSALSKYKLALKSHPYDLTFIDVRLPSKNSKVNSGDTLASIFKNLNPETKIVIITGHYDAFVFHNILHNINPDGLLYKSDIGMEVISEVVESVLKDIPYYSPTVLQLLRKNIASNILLNDTDKMLLYELAKGSKTKDLKKRLPLSQGGIERRKRFLKEVFNTQKQNDKALLKAAEEKGFL